MTNDLPPRDSRPAAADLPLIEAVRTACLAAARDAYEDAGIRGLCAEGRWEAAVRAIAAVDPAEVARRFRAEAETR